MSTTIIDDSDPSQVKYDGAGWTKGGTSHENAGTVTSSTEVGDSFTVTFTGASCILLVPYSILLSKNR